MHTVNVLAYAICDMQYILDSYISIGNVLAYNKCIFSPIPLFVSLSLCHAMQCSVLRVFASVCVASEIICIMAMYRTVYSTVEPTFFQNTEEMATHIIFTGALLKN